LSGKAGGRSSYWPRIRVSCGSGEASVFRKSYEGESQAPVGDTRFAISRRVSVHGRKNPLCAPVAAMDPSTPLRRAFAAQSSGFPGENLFESDAGAAGRTSAPNPSNTYFGVGVLSALAPSSCARRSRGPQQVELFLMGIRALALQTPINDVLKSRHLR